MKELRLALLAALMFSACTVSDEEPPQKDDGETEMTGDDDPGEAGTTQEEAGVVEEPERDVDSGVKETQDAEDAGASSDPEEVEQEDSGVSPTPPEPDASPPTDVMTPAQEAGVAEPALGEQRGDLAGPSTWDVFNELTAEDIAYASSLSQDFVSIVDVQEAHIQVADDSSVFFCTLRNAVKLDPEFKIMWKRDLSDATGGLTAASDCTVAADGAAYVASQNGQQDIQIVKYDPEGDLLWLSTITASGSEEVYSIDATSNGEVFVTGISSGQLPGQPAELAGNPFVMKVTADGDTEWIHQVEASTEFGFLHPIDIISSAAEEAYVSFESNVTAEGGGLMKKRGDGTLEWWTVRGVSESESVTIPSLGQISLHEETGTLYSFRLTAPPEEDGEYYDAPGLLAYHHDGTLDWFRNLGIEQETIDPVEGVQWTGAFSGYSAIAVGSDAIYLAGKYVNTFEFGSIERPDIVSGFVARYDLDGELVWFQQFIPPGTPRYARTTLHSVSIDGDTIVAAGFADMPTEEADIGTETALILLRLDPSDGHRL